MSDGKRYDPNRRVDWQPTSTVVGAFMDAPTGRYKHPAVLEAMEQFRRSRDRCREAMNDLRRLRDQYPIDYLDASIARRRREIELNREIESRRWVQFDW